MKKKKTTGRSKCFKKRDKWIKKLGFITYQNYLKSGIWKKIRKEKLDEKNYRCFYCGVIANEVHHTRYTKPVLLGLGDYYLSGLVVLCRNCHQDISDFAKENKLHEGRAFQLKNNE